MGSAGGVARRSSRVPEGCCAHSIRRDYFGSAPARAWILGRPTADRVLGLLVAGTSTAQYASYRSYSAPHEPAANFLISIKDAMHRSVVNLTRRVATNVAVPCRPESGQTAHRPHIACCRKTGGGKR